MIFPIIMAGEMESVMATFSRKRLYLNSFYVLGKTSKSMLQTTITRINNLNASDLLLFVMSSTGLLLQNSLRII